MSETINTEIEECGLKYSGHCDRSVIRVCGSNWGVDIPIDRMGDFTKLFPDIHWENGEFIHKLIGRYLRITVDDNCHVCAMHHITKPIDYFVIKERDENEAD